MLKKQNIVQEAQVPKITWPTSQSDKTSYYSDCSVHVTPGPTKLIFNIFTLVKLKMKLFNDLVNEIEFSVVTACNVYICLF